MGFSRQERTVVWVAISFSRGSCRPREWTSISYTGRWILYHWATREAPMIQPVLCKVRPKRWQGGADSGSPLSLPHCCVRIELSFFLVIVQSPSHVWLFTTPWTVARQAPLSMGILQARILEWVAMPFSTGSSWSMDQTGVSCIADGLFFTSWATA